MEASATLGDSASYDMDSVNPFAYRPTEFQLNVDAQASLEFTAQFLYTLTPELQRSAERPTFVYLSLFLHPSTRRRDELRSQSGPRPPGLPLQQW